MCALPFHPSSITDQRVFLGNFSLSLSLSLSLPFSLSLSIPPPLPLLLLFSFPFPSSHKQQPPPDTMWEVASNDSFLVAVGPETSSAEVAGIAASLASFPFVSGSATSQKLEQTSLFDTFYHCAGPEVSFSISFYIFLYFFCIFLFK